MAPSSGKRLFLIDIKFMWLYLYAAKGLILPLVNINVGGLGKVDCWVWFLSHTVFSVLLEQVMPIEPY